MTDFEKALKFVLEHETVYAKGHYGDMSFAVSENVEGDAGGLTKFGIDKASHPNVDVQNLTLEQASEIYRKEYWEKHKCHELPWPVNAVHFDNCVNMGASRAAKLLQRTVNMNEDGIIGPHSKIAIMSACKVRSAEVVALQLCTQKEEFYKRLVVQKPHLGKFEQGWLNRTNDLKGAIV